MKTYKNSNPFEINMYVQKTYEDESQHKKKIRGIASGPKKDRQGHTFSPEGVRSIQRAIEEGHIDSDGDWSEIPLVYEHETKWDSEIGWVTKAEIDEEGQLWIEAELDESSSKAMELYKRLTTPKKNGKMRQFGLSVKGIVTEYHKVWDDVKKSYAPVFNNMQLDEITVTSQPCYPADAYLAITKSLNYHQEDVMDNEETVVEKSLFDRIQEKQAEVEQAEPVVAEETEATEVATENEDLVASPPNEIPAEAVETEEVEEEVTQEPVETVEAETETPAGYAVHPQNAEGIIEVQKSIETLVSRISKLEEAIDTLSVREREPAVVEAVVEGDTVEVQKSESTSELARIESIVAEAIGTLTGELEIVKSLVKEISEEPADKSINIIKSKGIVDQPTTANEYRVQLVEQGVNPIRAGIQASKEFANR